MLKFVLVASSSLAMMGAVLAADLPRPEPVSEVPASIGKAPIGKAPVGKAPEPIITKG